MSDVTPEMRRPFLAGIAANPDADQPRLEYADWLDEHGEAEHAELIRVACELAGAWPLLPVVVTKPSRRRTGTNNSLETWGYAEADLRVGARVEVLEEYETAPPMRLAGFRVIEVRGRAAGKPQEVVLRGDSPPATVPADARRIDPDRLEALRARETELIDLLLGEDLLLGVRHEQTVWDRGFVASTACTADFFRHVVKEIMECHPLHTVRLDEWPLGPDPFAWASPDLLPWLRAVEFPRPVPHDADAIIDDLKRRLPEPVAFSLAARAGEDDPVRRLVLDMRRILAEHGTGARGIIPLHALLSGQTPSMLQRLRRLPSLGLGRPEFERAAAESLAAVEATPRRTFNEWAPFVAERTDRLEGLLGSLRQSGAPVIPDPRIAIDPADTL